MFPKTGKLQKKLQMKMSIAFCSCRNEKKNNVDLHNPVDLDRYRFLKVSTVRKIKENFQ